MRRRLRRIIGEPTPEEQDLGTVVERTNDRIVVEHRWHETIPIVSTTSESDVEKGNEEPLVKEKSEDIEGEETRDDLNDDGDYESEKEEEDEEYVDE